MALSLHFFLHFNDTTEKDLAAIRSFSHQLRQQHLDMTIYTLDDLAFVDSLIAANSDTGS